MVSESTADRLTRALNSPDPWTPLEELALDRPADLVAVVRAGYAGASSRQRRLLAWLLGQVRDEEADRVVTDLLADVGGADAAALLRTAMGRGVSVAAIGHPRPGAGPRSRWGG
ncbi:MAG TPA: hypothetical protein VFC19_24050 [Candidatus Limnocylindrales bacterium]|nr:hypothetical protein [Candidatus Limnocylindrales bacterium]